MLFHWLCCVPLINKQIFKDLYLFLLNRYLVKHSLRLIKNRALSAFREIYRSNTNIQIYRTNTNTVNFVSVVVVFIFSVSDTQCQVFSTFCHLSYICPLFDIHRSNIIQQIINNYWTRLSKILWIVSDEQIHYWLRQIINLRDNDKSRYFAQPSPMIVLSFNH